MTEFRTAAHCVYFRVQGVVQGVYFRASARDTATRLGLTGWVRNCIDGDVELIACGTAEQVEALEQWLWQGPTGARVSTVRRREAPMQDYDGFEILR